jgi:hypothetical protein
MIDFACPLAWTQQTYNTFCLTVSLFPKETVKLEITLPGIGFLALLF